MTETRGGLACAVLVLAAAAGWLVAPANAAVYWGSAKNGVGAASLDGSGVVEDYLYWPFGSESDGPACGVAVDQGHIYWAGWRGIGRRPLEGESAYPATVVGPLNGPCGITVDQDHLYWGNPSSGTLGRSNLDGSEPNSSFIGELMAPCDVVVGEGHVFWVEEEGIGRANLDGSAPERPYLEFPARNRACALATAGGYLYWGEEEFISRARLDGTEYVPAFIEALGRVNGIAVDAGHVYWVDHPWSTEFATVGRANLDGSEPDPTWIATDEQALGGVAVDGRPSPPSLTLPSRPIEFVRNAEFNPRSGAARIGIYVPGRGDLKISSPGLDWKVFRSEVPHAARAGSFLWYVRVRPKRGAAGLRIRSQLSRRGWARVTLHATYEQERVYPTFAARRLILRRYRGARLGWVKHPHPPRRSSR